jgi:hypothetical protein
MWTVQRYRSTTPHSRREYQSIQCVSSYPGPLLFDAFLADSARLASIPGAPFRLNGNNPCPPNPLLPFLGINMDKCWFVLRQSHYPPPEYSEAEDSSRGAICLGHVIPDLKHLDAVINTDSPEPYPANMPVFTTKKWSLNWETDRGRQIELSASGDAPIGPVQADASVKVVFQKSASNYSNFESLDTSIIQPTMAYIEDSLESELVQKELEGRKFLGVSFWTLFMVTGLVIARGAANKQHDLAEASTSGQARANVSGDIGVGANASVSSKKEDSISYQKASDFVWAVRLTKVTKRPFIEGVTRETVVKGATFSMGEEDSEHIEWKAELAAEGLDLGDDTNIFRVGEDTFVVMDE